jgi:hypothetical protein
VGRGLAALPYAQRAPALAHLAPRLAATGLSPQIIAGFDPTDANLAAAASAADDLGARLQAS